MTAYIHLSIGKLSGEHKLCALMGISPPPLTWPATAGSIIMILR